MIKRRKLLSLVFAAMLFETALPSHAQSAEAFDKTLSEITHGRPISADRVSIASDNIVKEGEPLLVTVDIIPGVVQRDEVVELNLLMSEGPWPRAYTAVLRSHGGHAHFATRLRVSEDCTLHAVAEIDGKELFGATREVKVSAGAYMR
jgi:predicted secreted protein